MNLEDDLRATVERWIEDSVARLRHNPNNARSVGRIVNRFIAEASVEDFDDLKPVRLIDWLRSESERKAPRTVRNELAAIRQWARWLAAFEVIDRSPFESVRVARCDSDDGCDAISDEQARDLIRNVREERRDPRWHVRDNAPERLVAYLLMLDSGFRIGEVRGQRWRDVDLRRGVIRVSTDKAARRDVVELSRRTVAALRWLRLRQLSRGSLPERVVPSGPNAKKCRADLDRVGCSGEGGRFHRLRKYAITKRAEDGWDLWSLVRFARHRDPKTTMRYVKPANPVRRAALS